MSRLERAPLTEKMLSVERDSTQAPSSLQETAPLEMPVREAAWAIFWGLLLILLIAIAIRYTELVSGNYVSNGVPPLPAFAVLLVMSLVRPSLRRLAPRLAPTRAQMLLIYSMLTVAVILNGLYHVRAFLPHLVAMQYWGKETGPLAVYAKMLPAWLAPHDQHAIADYYDGTARGGRIPWGVWQTPLACWSLFFIAGFVGIFSLISLAQRQWLHDEKLSFPLLAIPLALASEDSNEYGSRQSRRVLFAMGFGIALLFNGFNILHVLSPAIPAPGFEVRMAGVFTTRPWEPLQSVRFMYMLDTIGIGYFIPLDITFSTWFFYLVNRMIAVGGTMAGVDTPGFPFAQEQSAGGYIAMGFILLWGLRRSFGDSLKRVLGRAPANGETSSERAAWIGLAGSLLFLLGFCHLAGFSLWLSLPYLGVIGLFVLVYARIRAETGMPFSFIYPDGLPKEIVLNAISTPTALSLGGERSFVLFSVFGWLSRFHHPLEQAAYQIDSRKLAEEARISRRILFTALFLAFVVGLFCAYWTHLSAYYAQGSNLVASAGGTGEYREALAHQEYAQMAVRLATPPHRDYPRLFAAGGGFSFVLLLTLIRHSFIGCPLHPLGFLMANAYGDAASGWFPMLIAWFLKATILRVGGLKLYRAAMPLFLGLAIGHFLIGGVLWPLGSLAVSRTVANGYHLVFGE